MGNILVVDDEPSMRMVLKELLADNGHNVVEAENGARAMEALAATGGVDVVISDVNMPDVNGIDLMRKIKETYPSTEVMIITAFGSIDSAVQAMKSGAFDYVTKPLDIEEISIKVEKVLKQMNLRQENQYLKEEIRGRHPLDGLTEKSPLMHDLMHKINRVAQVDTTVLILGESGVGKELVARYLHYRGVRRSKPFVKVDCPGLTETLLESELFGHEKGAFTGAYARKKGRFEVAAAGTIFLDEIGDIKETTQVKLLRVLQDKEFERVGGSAPIKTDARVIAATNQDLAKLVEQGTFRDDLYFRLNIITLRVPPLRERKEDIPYLVTKFIKRYNDKSAVKLEAASEEVMDAFMRWNWPGNVRELENIIQRAAVLAMGPIIQLEDLPREMVEAEAPKVEEEHDISSWIEDMEKKEIIEALKKARGNKAKAAQLLGKNRSTLYYYLKKYKLE